MRKWRRRRIEGAQMWLVTRERERERTLGFWDRRTAIEGGRKRAKRREREREELAAEFVDGLLHVCQHVYVSR